jgi:prephenate dehydratase
MIVAYQGQPGAFGHEACLAFLPGCEPLAKPTFAAVIEAVIAGEADLGILPVENSCAGSVEEAQALIERSPLTVVSSHMLPVRMHLLGVPGSSLERVNTVSSHPVALTQCARTIRSLGLIAKPAANTAIAAQTLAASRDLSSAVLASEAAASIYGLTIFRHDVHDDPDNATSFSVLQDLS